MVLSTGICDCLSHVLFLLRQVGRDKFQYTVALPFRKPLVLLLAFASNSFKSKVFLLVLTILSDEVALLDESVAIGVQIEVFYHSGSATCFLGVVF